MGKYNQNTEQLEGSDEVLYPNVHEFYWVEVDIKILNSIRFC